MLKLYDLNEDLIWVTFINYGYIHYTKNFLKSMEKNKITFKLIVFCNDDKTYDELESNPQCICIKTDFLKTKFSDTFTIWGKSDYIRICFAKLDVILYALKETYDIGVKAVGYIDTDVFLFSDPTPVMVETMKAHKDIQVFGQCDEGLGTHCSNPRNCLCMCAGVMVFRNNPELYPIFSYTEQNVRSFASDQHYLDAVFKRDKIPRLTIERKSMPNGTFYPNLRQSRIVFDPEPCLLHFNYMVGHQKEQAMRLQGLWLL